MTNNSPHHRQSSLITRFALIACGMVLLGIGGIGVVVPGLPTFVFWVLAAVCFGKSCPAMQRWIYRRPRIGPAIERYVKEHRMSTACKRRALIGMWLGMTASACVILATGKPAWIVGIIGLCGLAVSCYLIWGIASESQGQLPQNLQSSPA